jgi:hypothetical protein
VEVVDVLIVLRCAGCGALFGVCEADYRGHIYGSEACARKARRATKARHQRSPEGRLDHSAHNDVYRAGLRALKAHAKSVRDTRSTKLADEVPSCLPDDASLSAVEEPAVVVESTGDETNFGNDAAASARDAAPGDVGTRRGDARGTGPDIGDPSARGDDVSRGPCVVASAVSFCCEISGALRVQPMLCRPRRPTDKGSVERANRFLHDRFFAARAINSIEDGNRQLLTFIRDIADARPHPRFRERSVADVFAEEKPRLLALPDTLPETNLVAPANVDTTAFVRFGTNSYSVPPRYARQTVTLVASDCEVRLLNGGDVLARHDRCWGKHQRIEDHAHRRALLEQKRAARVPKTRDRLLANVAGMTALYARWVDVGRHIGLMTARASKLLDLYGADVLTKAVGDVLARGLHDPGALALRCEQVRRAAGTPMPVALELGAHVHDCDVTPHDLSHYDRPRSTS